MHKCFCDICGREIFEQIPLSQECCPILAACHSVQDLCADCYAAGQKIKLEQVLLPIWRQAASGAEADDTPPAGMTAGPSKTIKTCQKAMVQDSAKKPGGAAKKNGEHWAIKRETHQMLKDYREKNGLGCLDALSKKSGVSVEILRSMLEAQPNPINTWLMVRDAITALEKAEKKGP